MGHWLSLSLENPTKKKRPATPASPAFSRKISAFIGVHPRPGAQPSMACHSNSVTSSTLMRLRARLAAPKRVRLHCWQAETNT